MRKITIKGLLVFYLLFVFFSPLAFAEEYYTNVVDSSTGVITVFMRNFTNDAFTSSHQIRKLPIPENRKSYIELSLREDEEGWSSAYCNLYDINLDDVKRNDFKDIFEYYAYIMSHIVFQSNKSWSGDVNGVTWYIETYAHKDGWGYGDAWANVKIYPYFKLNPLVENPSFGGIYINNKPLQDDMNYEYKAGTVVTLKAEAKPGFDFVCWEGSVSSNSPTIDVRMNEDKNIKAVFGDIYVDDVTMTATPIFYRDQNVQINWNAVADTSGIKVYQILVTESNQTPTDQNDLLTTVDTSLVLSNLTSKKSYYAWVRALDKVGNVSKNWLKIGPLSPNPRSSENIIGLPQAKIENGKPYYEVVLNFEDVDAAKYIIQRYKYDSSEVETEVKLTYEELQAKEFNLIDTNNLKKHAQYMYGVYTENTLGEKSETTYYEVTIPNISSSFQILAPEDGMISNRTEYLFEVPKIDIEGDEVWFCVRYSKKDDDKICTSSKGQGEVDLSFPGDGEWEWELVIDEYDQEVLVSTQVTQTRTLYIDTEAPTGDFAFTSTNDTALSRYTNNENIKLALSNVKDSSGIVNSGVAGIYLWNTEERPADFHEIEIATLPSGIDGNEIILSDLATSDPAARKGLYIDIPSGLEETLNMDIPWRLTFGNDGERLVSMEIEDQAGNISAPITKSIILDTDKPVTPAFTGCTFDDSKIVFNWYLDNSENDLDSFYVVQPNGQEIKVEKVLDDLTNNRYKGSFGVVIDYENAQQYNQPIKICVYATDLAGNKSDDANLTGYTKAKLGELGALTSGYNKEDKHYFTLAVTGGIAERQILELSKAPNFDTIEIVELGPDDRFVASQLDPHSEYFYRLVATNNDGVRTVGMGTPYNVPNQLPPTPENLRPVGFATTQVKFIFDQLNEDVDGDKLTYRVYWDNGAPTDFKPVAWDEQQACFCVTLSPDDHGKTYHWYVEVDDGHGGTIESEKVTFVLDAIAPVLTLKKPDIVYINQEGLEFSVSDELSGIEKIEYQLTDAATNNFLGEVQTLDANAGIIPLPEGYYHLTVTGTDRAGNQTTEQLNNLRVDRTSPELAEAIAYLPNNGSEYLSNTARIPLTWEAIDDHSGIQGLLYWVQNNPNQPLGEAKYIPLSPQGETYALSLDLGAGSGRYYLILAVRDRAGNQSAPTEIAMPIMLDTTPPEVAFEVVGFRSQGADYYLTPETQLTLKEVSEEDKESGITEKSFSVVETGSNQVITDRTDWNGILGTPFLPGKSYQINYRATNQVGLSSEVRSVEFIYDETPPEGLTVSLPQSALAKGEIGIFLATAAENETRILKYQLGIGSAYNKRELTSLILGNNDGWINLNTHNSSAEFRVEMPEIADGTYYLTLAVENSAGLRATRNTGTIVINNQQERVIVNDQGPYSMFDTQITGFWHYAGVKTVNTYQYRLIDQDDNVVPNANWQLTTEQSATLTQLDLTAGNTYRFEARAIFDDDTVSASGFSPGVTIDNTLPMITALETPPFTTSWNLAFRWEGEDNESGISRIQAALGSDYYQTDLTKGWVDLNDQQGKINCDASGEKLVFDLDNNNRYYLTLRLINGAGLASELASPCMIIDDTPPPTPVVVDQGSYINTSTHQPLEANWIWTPEDKESGTEAYEYAILKFGESVTENTIWCQGDERKSFSLTMDEFPRLHGQTYYVAVKATNGASLATIGYSDGIMVDENAPILTKVMLMEAANLGDAEAPEVNYITDNKNLGLWIESYDPESEIDRYLYTWGEEGQVDANERLISAQEIIRLDNPAIDEGVITIFLGETKNGAQIESDTGYSTGVILDPCAPKIHHVRGCLSGNRLLFDWSVEASVSPVVRYEYILVTESEYSQLMSDENQIIPWKTAPDQSRSLVINANGIADGRYYLVVRGYNAAGTYSRNQGDVQEWGTSPLLIIDRTPPAIIEEEFKTPKFVDEVLSVRVGAEDTLSGIHSYQYALGKNTDLFCYSEGWVEVENNNGLIDLPNISTKDLPHNTKLYLMVRVKDNVGLWSEAKLSPAIIIDHTKPVQPQVTCGNFATDQSQVTGISFHSKDPESGLTHYRIGIVKETNGGEWLFSKVVEIHDNTEAFAGLTFDQLKLEEAERYYLAVQTRNGTGAWSETGYSASFLVDTIRPALLFKLAEETIVLNQPPIDIEYELTEDAKVNFILLGADGTTLGYTFDGEKGLNSFRFNERIPQRYILSAEATDLAGNTGDVKEQHIRVNASPQITLPSEINTTPGAPTKFVATVSDPDGEEGDSFSYEWDPGDESDPIVGDKAEHRYGNTITEYILTLKVTDKDGGVAEATTTVKVRNTVSGMLYMDEIWTGEHWLYGDVIVPEEFTLTIKPGTEVILDRVISDTSYGHRLVIKGNLLIEGDSSGVSFRSVNEEGIGWEGIYLEGQARIDGLSLSQAMRGITVTETGILTVTNSVFSNNLLGIHCYSPGVVILNTRFNNNTWYGLKEDAGGRPEVRNCTFSANKINYYYVEKTDLSEAELNAVEGNEGNRYEQ